MGPYQLVRQVHVERDPPPAARLASVLQRQLPFCLRVPPVDPPSLLRTCPWIQLVRSDLKAVKALADVVNPIVRRGHILWLAMVNWMAICSTPLA